MIIKVIDWNAKTIKEIEVKIIRYLDDGIHYDLLRGNTIHDIVIPYQNFLGIKED